jgi:4-diphosphocytidyl-2-C-methyl-D-erythritol kinase
LPVTLAEKAPAKVNLTLRVLGRRADGYHELESLVVFADFGDRLTLAPGGGLSIALRGPRAASAGADADNLVLKAARILAERIPGIVLGAFDLEKNVPVAAGLGGGSSDAAATLRLIAQANNLTRDDPRLHEAARATGADVSVCLDPRVRLMRGIGERLSEPFNLPTLAAVLVNPGAALATKLVFAGWRPAAEPAVSIDIAAVQKVSTGDQLLRLLLTQPNDLEVPAITLAPVIAEVLAALRELADCNLARMSGSGSTCFGLFASPDAAQRAANALHSRFPHWWVCATALGNG